MGIVSKMKGEKKQRVNEERALRGRGGESLEKRQ